MLNWWLGKPHAEADRDGDTDIEPPETPAPVFAARALRSAFFGTPAPPKDDMSYIHMPEQLGENTNKEKVAQKSQTSPVKLPGILMTPGTATSRRKTVSFGNEVVDKGIASTKQPRRASDGARSQLSRSTTLTQALEDARQGSTKQDKSTKAQNVKEPITQEKREKLGTIGKHNTDAETKFISGSISMDERVGSADDFDGDMTMDLNDPHSQSGKFWKTEFQNYHDGAQTEMKKLLQYKQKAKNYAKMKDAEVLGLNQQLKEERRRVSQLEDRLSRMTSRPRAGRVNADGYDADDDTPELTRELARQTALAAQYKSQIEEIELQRKGSSSLTTFNDFNLDARETSSYAETLREEILRLQRELKTSQRENDRLQGSNKKLTQSLVDSDARIDRLSGKVEQRRVMYEDMRRKKDEALDQLQQTYENLKEQARTQRKDAEEVLLKRQQQLNEVKKELSSKRDVEKHLKALEETLRQKTAEHGRAIAEYEIQLAELKRDVILGAEPGLDLRASIQHDPSLASSMAKHDASIESTAKYRESQIPIASQSTSRPTAAAERRYRSETPTSSPPKRLMQPLLDVINNASPNSIPPLQSGPVQFTPAINRFSEMSSPQPDFDLPSAEPSLLDIQPHIVYENKQYASPRPTMIHMSSDRPNLNRARPQLVQDARATSEDKLPGVGATGINRLDDSRARRPIPPERAAAAKARLEQKNAEKKKAQELAKSGKENLRN